MLAAVPAQPAAVDRFRRLAARDRVLLLLTVVWSVIGVPANYLRAHGFGVGAWQLLAQMILWAAIAGVIAYSVMGRRRALADYGLAFNSGGIVSLAMIALIHGYLAISGKLVLSAGASFLWSAVGAFMEEIAFRVIAIDTFLLMLEGTKAKAFWAILASSALWSIPHIPSKTPAELQGLFLGSLLLGYVYYRSKSVLFPAWLHSLANAGYLGGIVIAGLYCLLGAAGWTVRSRKPSAFRSASVPGSVSSAADE